MKKFFMIAVMAVAALTASAQTPTAGSITIKPYVGLSLSNITSLEDDPQWRAGFTVGAEGMYMANDWLGISAGVEYQQQGCKFDQSGYTGKYKLDYINIPILANFYIAKGLAVKAGIQPGIAVNRSFDVSASGASGSVSASEMFSAFDFAIPVGISYEISKVVIDARFNVGALSVLKEDYKLVNDKTPTNEAFQLTVGYRF